MATQPYRTKDGERVPGASTVSKLIGDNGGLLYWANKAGLEGKTLDEARKKAADAGTLAHQMVELRVKGLEPMSALDGHPIDLAERAKGAFDSWSEWVEMTGFEPTIAEVSLISERHRYGGTLDCIGTDRKGRLVLGDLKTGSLYEDHLLQIAAYRNLWEEHHDQKIEVVQLWRFSPEGVHAPHQFPLAIIDTAWSAFQHALALYHFRKPLKKAIG